MKFYCDNCQTKYSISDEKVRGKVLKVRCKKCSHVITVREPRAPAGQSAKSVSTSSQSQRKSHTGRIRAAAPPPRGPATVEWHYSVNGESFGPLAEAALKKMFADGSLGDATYVWNETFAGWKPVKEVDVFGESLRKAAAVKPPPKTLGISGAMESLDREMVEREEARRRTEKESAAVATALAPEDETVQDDELSEAVQRIRDGNEDGDGNAARSNRLKQLRQRLKLDDDEGDEEPSRDAPRSEPSAREEPEVGDEIPDLSDLVDDDEADIGHADTLLDSREDDSSSGSNAQVHDGLFSAMDGESEPATQAPTPEAEEPAEAADDAVPFFPSAPKLGESKDETTKSATMSRVDEITGSLLIQINEIKKDGRKRVIFGTLGALVALAVLGTVAFFGWDQLGSSEEVEEESGLVIDNIGQTPEFHSYSEEDLAQVREKFVLQEEIVISREAGKAAIEREERRESGESVDDDSGPTMPTIDPSLFAHEDRELEGSRASDDDTGESGSRFSRPGLRGAGGSGGGGLAGAEQAEGSDDEVEDDRFLAMQAVQSDTQRQVHDDGSGVDLRPRQLNEGLTGGEIARGIQNVSESIAICRERHIYRGGTLEANQLEVILTVTPEGRIGKFDMKPSNLDDTDFGRCMDSHTGRWRFPRFTGDPVEVVAPISLQ